MTQDVIAFDGFDIRVDLDRWPAKILRALLRRHYEKHELRLVARLLQPGDRVLELGCAIGVVALAASRITAPDRIVCFDANPDMVAEARGNFALNGVQIAARNAVLTAAADTRTEVTFYKAPYFLSSSLEPRTGDATAITVPTESLEQAIANGGANVLIVDIEGGEFELLGTADLHGIEKLVLELHVSMADVGACMTLIEHLALRGLHLDPRLSAHNVFVFTADAPEGNSAGWKTGFAHGYLTALERSDTGDTTGAIDALKQALDENPSNAHAHLLLSQLLLTSGATEPALTAAERAFRLDPANEDTLEQLGVLHSASGNPDKAKTAYNQAIGLVPHRPLFHAGLGAVLARQGRSDEALSALHNAAALNPKRANTLAHVLALASRQDKFAGDNAAATTTTLPDGFDQQRFLVRLADVVSRRFRFADAASSLDWAVKLAPDDHELQCGLALQIATPKDVRRALGAL